MPLAGQTSARGKAGLEGFTRPSRDVLLGRLVNAKLAPGCRDGYAAGTGRRPGGVLAIAGEARGSTGSRRDEWRSKMNAASSYGPR